MLIVKCPLLMNQLNMTLKMKGVAEWRSIEDCKSCDHCHGFTKQGARPICSGPLPVTVRKVKSNPIQHFKKICEEKTEDIHMRIVECDSQFYNFNNDPVALKSCQECEFHKGFRTVTGPNWKEEMSICSAEREWVEVKEVKDTWVEDTKDFRTRVSSNENSDKIKINEIN